MQISAQTRTALLGVAGVLMFSIGAGVTACVAASPQPAAPVRRPKAAVSEPNIVVSYAREHPDPAIKGPFAEKLASGEIRIVLEKPTDHAMASFGLRKGVYVLTFDPERLKTEPTREEYEDVLSILSHEHAHYRQFVEGEMTNYYPRGGPMTEAQCTLTVLVEIDAHGKACRDARAYGWKSHVALSSCDRTTASLAGYFLRERIDSYPECEGVWKFFSETGSEKPAPKPKAERPAVPRRRSAGLYLPPQ